MAARVRLALPDSDRARTAVFPPTHAIRREINETEREEFDHEGMLHGRALRWAGSGRIPAGRAVGGEAGRPRRLLGRTRPGNRGRTEPAYSNAPVVP